MNAARVTLRNATRLIPYGLVLLSFFAPEASHGGSAFIDMDDIVREVKTPHLRSGKSQTVAIAEPDDQPTARICIDCERETLRRKQARAPKLDPPAERTPETATSSLDDKLALIAFKNAVRPRRMAQFMSRSRAYRSGNHGKGMCAQATKETLVEAGICASYPQGNAYALQGLSSLVRSCGQHVRKLDIMDPRKAPKNSVIIYSGYAGHRPHKFGHVENKIVVTAALKRKYSHDSTVRGSQIGQTLYCSDFCRPIPTMTRHNPVAAIYQLI